MGHKFEGIVLLLIGLSNLLVANAISHAETTELVQLSPTHLSIVGIRAPIDILMLLGVGLVFAGVIWIAIGGKFEKR